MTQPTTLGCQYGAVPAPNAPAYIEVDPFTLLVAAGALASDAAGWLGLIGEAALQLPQGSLETAYF